MFHNPGTLSDVSGKIVVTGYVTHVSQSNITINTCVKMSKTNTTINTIEGSVNPTMKNISVKSNSLVVGKISIVAT